MNKLVFHHHVLRSRLNLSVPIRRLFSKETAKPSTGMNFKTTQLENGLRIASESSEHAQTATVGVWIDAGSRLEDTENNGAAHFLEHMFFKGSRKRTQHGLEREIENMGAHLNAYTSREQSAYFAQILSQDLPKAMEILSDMLLHAKLDSAAIERERDVILREQQEVDKQMEEVVFDHLHAVAFPNQSLGRTILGSSANIRSLQRSHLESFVKAYYVPSRMVISAAGGVDHDQLVSLARKYFAANSKDSLIHHQGSAACAVEKAKYMGAEMRLRNDTMDEAHIVISVQGASWTNADYFALLVAQAIVGSWNRGLASAANGSSRLARVVAENNLATSFTSFNTSYSDTGLFGIYMVSDRKYDLDDLVYEVQQEWVRICLNANEVEVERAKTQLKASLLLSLDGTTAICEDIGRQMLAYGRRYSWRELHAMIDAVDAATVRRVASEYLYDRDPAIVAIGPIGSVPDYSRIRAATLWLRN